MNHPLSPRRLSLVSIGVLGASLLAAAHATEPPVIRVESSTIDDRFEDKRSEPSNIGVIHGDTVDGSHAENIQQLLQSIPGVTTELQSGDSLKIHIRGVENQRYMGEKPGVAVVIDGVPVFERTGRVNIDLDNIESIKVIKGGASYLYGEDALSGAVIITTKRGTDQSAYKLAGEAGSFGYRKGLARAGHGTDQYNAYLQASHREADGYHFESDYSADYLNGKLQYYIDDASDVTFGFEASERAKDSHGTVEGETQAKEDPESVAGRDYTRHYDVNLTKYFVTYARDVGEHDNFMLNLYRFGDRTGFVSAPQNYDATGAEVTDVDAYTTDNDYRQVQRGVKGEWFSAGTGLGWMAGLDLRDNTYQNESAYLVDFKRSRFSPVIYRAGTPVQDNTTDEQMQAVYGEIKFSPAPRWLVTGNGRHDRIALDYSDGLQALELEEDFNVNSWRLGANYQAATTLDVYTNASTGFRTPTIQQLFAGTISPTGDTASNPDLEPEESVNLEIGLRGKFTAYQTPLDFDVAIFQIERDDFIMSTAGQYAVPESGVLDRYENVGGVRNRGLELALRSDAARKYSFDLAYTYLDAEFTRYDNFNLILGNRYANPTIEHYNNAGNTVPRSPEHHLNLTVRSRITSELMVGVEMDAISSYYADELNRLKIDGYTVFNLLANYDVTDRHELDWSLFARIDNLFDEDYYNTARSSSDRNADGVYDAEDLSIVVNPGIRWTAGVSVTF